jgi:hypothetical protein
MLRILSSTTRSARTTNEYGDETQQDVIASVTYVDHAGAAHTLTFHPKGTDVSGDAEDIPRIVGDHVPEFTFHDAREAVNAYETGEV